MPTAKPLSKLERVPLREAWKHEAGDFTPWLAEAANLDALVQPRPTVQRHDSRRGGSMRWHWCHKPWHKPHSRGRRSMGNVGARLAEKIDCGLEATASNGCAFAVGLSEKSIVQRAVGRLTRSVVLLPSTRLCRADRCKSEPR
jgi:hypothetical protein